MTKKISLIIPSHDDEKNLINLLEGIPNWERFPDEIIIVDSSQDRPKIPKDFCTFLSKNDVQFKLFHEDNLYPGHARNIGIKNASNILLAFLDTATHPTRNWLSSGLKLIDINNSDGVWGKTFYKAKSLTAKIIRASTFGVKPIITFPGSIFNKEVFNKCGHFIESVRAGEDIDWMSRAELQRVNVSTPYEYLSYDKLNETNIVNIIIKWFRNYTFNSQLPHARIQKDYYFYIISLISVVIAYNWNSVLAAWDTSSFFYIPNITKISVSIIVALYLLIRGIFLPRKKGVSLKFLFPVNFIFIVCLSLLIDITKTLAFAYSKVSKQ